MTKCHLLHALVEFTCTIFDTDPLGSAFPATCHLVSFGLPAWERTRCTNQRGLPGHATLRFSLAPRVVSA